MAKLHIALGFFILFSQYIQAQEFPQRLAPMGNENPEITDSLNAKCGSIDAGDSLTCVLTTTSIDYVLDPAQKDERVEQFFYHAELANSLPASIESLFSEEQCQSVLQGVTDSAGSPKAAAYRKQLSQLCGAEPNAANARTLLDLQTDIESQTCKIWGSSGDITFARTGPSSWGLQTEPEGLCEVYEVFTLECDRDNMYYCEYDEHAVYGKKTGEYCEGFEEVVDEGDHYSSEITMNFEMQCSFIQFTY